DQRLQLAELSRREAEREQLAYDGVIRRIVEEQAGRVVRVERTPPELLAELPLLVGEHRARVVDLDQIGMTRQVDGAVCISVYGIALPQGAERREGILDEVEADGVQIERADVYHVHRRTVSNTTRTNGAIVGTSLGRAYDGSPYELDMRPQPG